MKNEEKVAENLNISFTEIVEYDNQPLTTIMKIRFHR